jgi:hypothetical protein
MRKKCLRSLPKGVLRPRRSHAIIARILLVLLPVEAPANQHPHEDFSPPCITSGRGKWMASRHGCQRGR